MALDNRGGGHRESLGVGTITYIGWLGHANIGDEALLISNRRLFSPHRLIPDGQRQHSKITLFGGGTVLPRWTMWVLPNVYNYAFGVGVSSPSFWGPFPSSMIERMRRFNFRFLGVRGNTSRRYLESWGLKSEVIGDPCLILEPSRYDRRDDTKIGVNFGTSGGQIWGGNERRIIREAIELCRRLRANGYNPELIPFWGEDVSYVREISAGARCKVFEDWMDVQKLLDEIASCHVLIGEKLHSLVFSATTHTPFISIEYRPKCYDFAETMGFRAFNIRTDEMTAQRILGILESLLAEWDGMRRVLIERVENYRRRLKDSSLLIKKDISSLPDDKWDSRPLAYPRWIVHNRSQSIVHNLKKKPSPRQVVKYLSRHIYSHNDDGSS